MKGEESQAKRARANRHLPAIALALAVVASLAIHLPVYGVLGVLAKWFEDKARAAGLAEDEAAPDELAFVEMEDIEFEVEGEPSDVIVPPRLRTPQTRAQEFERREQELEPPPEPEEAPAEMRIVRQPPPEAMNKQAVQQRSRDPNVEAPEDAQFIARENNRVEEETQARLRSYSQDAEEINAGEPTEQSEVEEEGNADEQLSAEHREMEGSEDREATETESNMERPEEANTEQLPNVEASGETEQQESGAPAEQIEQREQVAQTSGGGVRYETVTVSDGEGTFVIRRPVQPEGSGAGQGGGATMQARAARARRRGRRGTTGLGRGQSMRGPDLRVSWNQFEEIISPEQLEREREAYVRERLSKQRGRSQERQQRWADFRAAIENYVPNVRPGNQTALNAAASPFAEYIAAVHRRMHRSFAGRFIRGLPAGAGNPFSDMSLRTKLEIVFNGDGSIDRVGVVRTSGLLPFDYGAYNAVMRGQPYPAPPSSIKSGNGKVYIHWSFYRNARQCGTFNAEPYVLPNPPGSPQPRRGGPFQDNGPEWGGVVPEGARPTWGTESEGESESESEEEGESEEEPAGPDAADERRRRLPGNLG